MYQAAGRGGQRLIVWPAKDIAVAITGGGFDPGQIAPFLLRALKSNAALSANPDASGRLLARVREVAMPGPAGGASPPLPSRASAISGLEFAIDPNPLGVQGMQLRFLDQLHAEARIRLREAELVVPVGLDGAYRFGIEPPSNDRVAGRGRWTGADQFTLEIDPIVRINHFTVLLYFERDRLRGRVSERAGLVGETLLSGRAGRGS